MGDIIAWLGQLLPVLKSLVKWLSNLRKTQPSKRPSSFEERRSFLFRWGSFEIRKDRKTRFDQH
jgi:hypothetical protein